MKKKSRKLGRLSVSLDLIKSLLDLPKETVIVRARESMDKPGIIEFLIEHPYLREIIEGAEIPIVSKEDLNNAGYDA